MLRGTIRVSFILIVISQLVIKHVTSNPRNYEVVTPFMISSDINEFSLNLYKKISEAENGNLISSPFSVWVLLSLLTIGTNRITKLHLESVLNHRPSDEYYTGVQLMIKSLKLAGSAEVHLSNKIFVNNWLKIHQRFQYLGKTIYDSNAQSVDFRDSLMTCNIINHWITQNTEGAIKGIVRPDNLDRETSMMLVSVLYFEGKWVNQFAPYGTRKRLFYLEDGTTTEIPTMYSRNYFKHIIVDYLGFTIIELPYKSTKSISMFVIYPNQHQNLHAVEASLLSTNLQNLMMTVEAKDTIFYLPKFTIESEINLEIPLRKLGIHDIFENYAADFTNFSNESIHVSSIIQKVVIEVTETGTMAAALSEGQLESRMSSTKIINVNRPFLVFIYCDGVNLFNGRVVNPEYPQKNIINPF
ncbi:hypothetical protein HCN44_007063 [Aphidius gifuensis]|uniref:Serpin domain-containing protein n=1 Tax=Aphidius gifuensis TaxID=684658 RepID=A0A834XK82_APHGI|nr:antichymotrypsin-2-like [Aphidius gifuensis]KAF7988753.1 hypothetical protein HCN44_007063 [Aphidius gifuensis]